MKTLFFTKIMLLAGLCIITATHAVIDANKTVYAANITEFLRFNRPPQSWLTFYKEAHLQSFNHLDLERSLLNNNRLLLKDIDGNNALLGYLCYSHDKHYNAFEGLRERNWWLDSPINLDEQNHKGETALMLSSSFGFRENVSTLLVASVNAILQDKDGKTAHIHALEALDVDTFKLLFEKAPEAIGIKDNNGDTIAEYAIRSKKVDHKLFLKIIQAMLAQNKSPSITSLWKAENRFSGYVWLALCAGVLPTPEDIEFFTKNDSNYVQPLQCIMAYYASPENAGELFKTYDADILYAYILRIALWQNHLKTIQTILNQSQNSFSRIFDYCHDWNLTDPLDAIFACLNLSDDFKTQYQDFQNGTIQSNRRILETLSCVFTLCCSCLTNNAEKRFINDYAPLQDDEKKFFEFCQTMIQKEQEGDTFAAIFLEKLDKRLLTRSGYQSLK